MELATGHLSLHSSDDPIHGLDPPQSRLHFGLFAPLGSPSQLPRSHLCAPLCPPTPTRNDYRPSATAAVQCSGAASA
jgi:hypothetical protein